MSIKTINSHPCKTRDLADLLKNPYDPLTPEQVEHLDEYMSFKNHDKSAKEVCITSAVNRARANMNSYFGIPGDKK